MPSRLLYQPAPHVRAVPVPHLPPLPPERVSEALAQGRTEARRNGWDVDDLDGCDGFIARLDGEEVAVWVEEAEERAHGQQDAQTA